MITICHVLVFVGACVQIHLIRGDLRVRCAYEISYVPLVLRRQHSIMIWNGYGCHKHVGTIGKCVFDVSMCNRMVETLESIHTKRQR